jgi:phosphoribosylformylglycinamidine cyclo-ligase
MQRDRYREAGVDIDAGNEVVERIKPLVRSTFRDGVLTDIGGFGGLFRIPTVGVNQPILVSSTDGVGTKLQVAQRAGVHHTVGIDLVGMCVNDIVVQGAEPLFFLDYFATGKLQPDITVRVIEGIAEGCRQANCALIGGETAEMPDMYPPGEYDLAGFSVGIVDPSSLIDGANVTAGMAVVGMASSGLHSNGFSLVRKLVFDEARLSLDQVADGLTRSLGEELLEPTRIYVRPLLEVIGQCDVAALAHITGGGLLDNLPRVLPVGSVARIERDSWDEPPVFDLLRRLGGLSETEMLRTFNCGVGMVAVMAHGDVDKLRSIGARYGIDCWVIGEMVPGADPAAPAHVEIIGEARR